MRAAVHVIPCAGVLADASGHPNRPSGIGAAGIRTAERLDEAADLVLVAVPAGQGQPFAERLLGRGRPVTPPTLDDRAPATAHWEDPPE